MEDKNWHVLTVTHGGTVSLLKNLTKEVAGEIARRLDPFRNIPNNSCFSLSQGTIVRVEAFGPEEDDE